MHIKNEKFVLYYIILVWNIKNQYFYYVNINKKIYRKISTINFSMITIKEIKIWKK